MEKMILDEQNYPHDHDVKLIYPQIAPRLRRIHSTIHCSNLTSRAWSSNLMDSLQKAGYDALSQLDTYCVTADSGR
jgi:hypothetical protein